MKELYVAPEAEVVRFVALENIADTNPTSVLDWEITDNKDGVIDYDKWFG